MEGEGKICDNMARQQGQNRIHIPIHNSDLVHTNEDSKILRIYIYAYSTHIPTVKWALSEYKCETSFISKD